MPPPCSPPSKELWPPRHAPAIPSRPPCWCKKRSFLFSVNDASRPLERARLFSFRRMSSSVSFSTFFWSSSISCFFRSRDWCAERRFAALRSSFRSPGSSFRGRFFDEEFSSPECSLVLILLTLVLLFCSLSAILMLWHDSLIGRVVKVEFIDLWAISDGDVTVFKRRNYTGKRGVCRGEQFGVESNPRGAKSTALRVLRLIRINCKKYFRFVVLVVEPLRYKCMALLLHYVWHFPLRTLSNRQPAEHSILYQGVL